MYFLNEYYNQWQKRELDDSTMALVFFTECHAKKYPNKKIHQLLSQGKHLIALESCSFKKVKNKALLSLRKWCLGEWSFKLTSKIPTPYEVLEAQSRGVRPVSMILQEEFKPILNREDCLEFFLHDLEHGYMFFYSDQLKGMQTLFFCNVLKSLENNLWDNYLEDKDFREKFHYLISDMNTHLEHYRYFLKSMLPVNDFDRFNELFHNDREFKKL
jgi:hypothetical protein